MSYVKRVRRRSRSSPILGLGLVLAALAAVGFALLLPGGSAARSEAAPVNTAEPQISGLAVVGQTLTGTTGTWANDPTSFAFQWLDCPQSGGAGDGSNCASIPFATSSTYTLSSSDAGFRIRVRVTASNSDGSASAASNATDIVAPAVGEPVNTGEPQISGSAMQGQTLTATTGTWTNDPTSFAFQWLHCGQDGGNGDGSNCPAIAGATTNSLQLQASDVGFRIRVRVTATNAAGSGTAASNPTGLVAAVNAPKNTVPPTISGTPLVGRVLTLARGTWTGTAPISYRYQWLRCDGNGGGCISIGGAVGLSWRITLASNGHTIRAQVTATNAGGSAQATTVPTAVVGGSTPAPPPTAAGCPAGSGPIRAANLKPPARLLIDRQEALPTPVRRGTRQIILRYHVSACGGRPVQGALVYATAVPFGQLSTPGEHLTGSNGFAELDFRTLAGFPVSPHQGLIAVFVRARKIGENVLGGISTRRLFSVHVQL